MKIRFCLLVCFAFLLTSSQGFFPLDLHPLRVRGLLSSPPSPFSASPFLSRSSLSGEKDPKSLALEEAGSGKELGNTSVSVSPPSQNQTAKAVTGPSLARLAFGVKRARLTRQVARTLREKRNEYEELQKQREEAIMTGAMSRKEMAETAVDFEDFYFATQGDAVSIPVDTPRGSTASSLRGEGAGGGPATSVFMRVPGEKFRSIDAFWKTEDRPAELRDFPFAQLEISNVGRVRNGNIGLSCGRRLPDSSFVIDVSGRGGRTETVPIDRLVSEVWLAEEKDDLKLGLLLLLSRGEGGGGAAKEAFRIQRERVRIQRETEMKRMDLSSKFDTQKPEFITRAIFDEKHEAEISSRFVFRVAHLGGGVGNNLVDFLDWSIVDTETGEEVPRGLLGSRKSVPVGNPARPSKVSKAERKRVARRKGLFPDFRELSEASRDIGEYVSSLDEGEAA